MYCVCTHSRTSIAFASNKPSVDPSTSLLAEDSSIHSKGCCSMFRNKVCLWSELGVGSCTCGLPHFQCKTRLTRSKTQRHEATLSNCLDSYEGSFVLNSMGSRDLRVIGEISPIELLKAEPVYTHRALAQTKHIHTSPVPFCLFPKSCREAKIEVHWVSAQLSKRTIRHSQLFHILCIHTYRSQ